MAIRKARMVAGDPNKLMDILRQEEGSVTGHFKVSI